jgi:hypothetical protein
MDGKLQSDVRVVAAVIIEREGEAKELLRVILPLGMQLPPGMRVIIDQRQPMNVRHLLPQRLHARRRTTSSSSLHAVLFLLRLEPFQITRRTVIRLAEIIKRQG